MGRLTLTKRIIVFFGVWLALAVIMGIFLAMFGTIIQSILSGIFFHSKFSGRVFLILFKENFLASLFGTFLTESVLEDNIACSPEGYLCFFSPLFIYSFGGGFVLTESRMPISYLINTPARLMRTNSLGHFRVGEEINMTIFNIFEARKTPHPNYLVSLIFNMFISLILLFVIFLIGLLTIIFVIALIGMLLDIQATAPTGDELPIPP